MQFGPLFVCSSWGFLTLSMFARPDWTFEEWASQYEDDGRYPHAALAMLPADATAFIALVLLSIVLTGLLLEMRYMSQNVRIDALVSVHGEHNYWRGIPAVHNPFHVDLTELHTTKRDDSSHDAPSNDAAKHSLPSVSTWRVALPKLFTSRYFQRISVKRLTRVFLVIVSITEMGMIITYLYRGNARGELSYHNLPSSWLCVLYILWFDYRSAANLKVLVSVLPKYVVTIP